MSLESLYQQVILDHYRCPRNFGTLAKCTASVAHDNPLCGDRISLDVDVQDDRIECIRFGGQGCAICTASTSMMTERVAGLAVDEAAEVARRFRAMMRKEAELDPESLGDLAALQGVVNFPVRVKCATLGWTCLEECLGNRGETGQQPRHRACAESAEHRHG